MFLLDSTQTLTELTATQLAIIIKYAIHIVCILLPIMLIFLWTSDILKKVFDPKDFSGTLKIMGYRLCCALIVFFIPTIVNYSTTLINDYDDTFITKYYEEATVEKYNLLKKQYDNELKAEKAADKLKLKEGTKEREEYLRKQQEQLEEINKKYDQAHPPANNGTSGQTGTYNPSGEQNGTYGSVTYNNGVFTIPNRRATSDSDIPKQSGQYGLNPIFWERLSKLIQDGKAQGYNITVTSGWRSYSSQRSLWDNSNRPCSERGKWVACPGGSRHGFGIAADLSFNGTSCSGGWDCNAAAKWAHANAANYGLKFRMSWEPWHIEPDNVQGGSFGSCNASC